MNVREQTESFENMILCENACHADAAVRDVPEAPCPLRTEFQRDRDRILHCTSFRRLKRKTQVFLSPIGDHYRTRLTHTLEVAQIARTMARALRMNEDLTEAIALGHDLGHSPFGHAGEAALNDITPGGYRHYEQSVRVVERIEKHGRGLNLTRQVRNGILCHTNMTAATREGNLVRLADRIAYINHDIDDACRAGILSIDDIPAELLHTLGRGHSERINRMVSSVIAASTDRPFIAFTDDVAPAVDELRAFLFRNVYENPIAKSEDKKAKALLCELFHYYVKYPERMPKLYQNNIEDEGVERCACDYVASMTDRFAIDKYTELFIPQVWRGR